MPQRSGRPKVCLNMRYSQISPLRYDILILCSFTTSLSVRESATLLLNLWVSTLEATH